jgi:methanogenic corrinoid protein MtbC1
MKIIGGPIGKDIHVAGILKFLDIARDLGHDTYYMGPANSVKRFIEDINRINPDIVAVSYRLSPETAEKILMQLKNNIKKSKLTNKRYLFGGTPATGEICTQMINGSCYTINSETGSILDEEKRINNILSDFNDK